MKNHIYCGADKVPKGQIRGSMGECLERKQVRFWGLKSVDSRIVAKHKSGEDPKTREQLLLKVAGIDGNIKKLKLKLQLDISKKADSKEIAKTEKQISSLEKQRAGVKEQLDLVEKKRKELFRQEKARKDAEQKKKDAKLMPKNAKILEKIKKSESDTLKNYGLEQKKVKDMKNEMLTNVKPKMKAKVKAKVTSKKKVKK